MYGHELGKNHVNTAFHGVVECFSYEGCDTDEACEAAIDDAVKKGAGVIFTTSPSLMPATLRSAIHYPKVRFLNCAVNLAHTAVRNYETRLYEAKFLMGALAATYTDNHRITYIADLPVYGSVANINAFAQGVAMIDPRAEIRLYWSHAKDFDQERIMRESASDVFSGPDLTRPEYYSREFGLYRVGEAGRIEQLAMPIRHWGRYYELLLSAILHGTYDTYASASDVTAVNYWWGLESGVVDIVPGSHLSTASKKLINALRLSVVMRAEQPFQHMDNKDIITMHTLEENITGQLPAPEALNDTAARLLRIVGLNREDAS